MARVHTAPLRKPILTPFTLVLAALGAAAIWFILQRFIHGIGAVTNVNPGYPWGIWVVVDVVIGSAIGCGGFAMAVLIYLFNKGEYSPLMRPALLGGLLGYTLAGAAVIIDLGRWWQVYNMFLPWHMNPNSVMLEIGLCVTFYVIVLWLEFAPAILDRLGFQELRRLLDAVMWVLIAFGVVLPFMHQSSLGTALIVLGWKLDPLYNTAWLPLLFVTSALAMGFGIVVVEATVVSRSFRRASEHALLMKLAGVVGWLLVVWTVFRWGEIALAGDLGGAFGFHAASVTLWIETALTLLAVGVFLTPARQNERAMLLAGVAVVAFGSLYRFAAYLVAYTPAVPGWRYAPSVPELMVTIGVIAIEILVYLTFIKVFPVLHGHDAETAKTAPLATR